MPVMAARSLWTSSGSVTLPEVTQFLARRTGTPHTAEYTALITSLVNDGVWPLLDALYIFATDVQANALLNLKSSSYTGTLNIATTFTADRGFTFTNTERVEANFNPVTDGGNFTQDAASMGVWVIGGTGGALSANQAVGTIAFASSISLFPQFSDGSCYTRINDVSNGFAIASEAGFTLGVRTSNTGRTGYRNKVSIGSYASEAAFALPNEGFQCGMAYIGQVPCFVFGGNIDSVQDKLYDALRTYMTAVGVP